MKFKFSDIEWGIEMVSMDQVGDHRVAVDKKTGAVYHNCEDADIEEIPEGFEESESAVFLPSKRALDLGSNLVFDFARSRIPEDYDKVRDFFSKRGAYGRFKDFLEQKGLLDEWHNFENSAFEHAVRQWCEDNEIELED